MAAVTTVSGTILDPLLRVDPVGPRITYYDDATGERIELSAATLANWAAKSGNLLRDELGAGPGSRVAVLLPAHWQTAAVLFGAWWVGAEALLHPPGDPEPPAADIALCTADRLAAADAAVGLGEVAVLSLDPFGRSAPDLPVGVTDFATAVRVHGDQIAAEPDPGPALAGKSVADLLAECQRSAAAQGFTAADRVLCTQPWATATALVDRLLAVLTAGGSL
ncbi:MAG TPA: TIGR03089 family protein, partial [Mycobacterium sp.]|nr:TIGR03089 family protein [Mycobacterium sp.]